LLAPAVRVEVDPSIGVDADRGAFDLRDAACRDLSRGAHAALRALRDVIGVPPARAKGESGPSDIEAPS
jgi:hypothetical protein